jgi:hypothetical protein
MGQVRAMEIPFSDGAPPIRIGAGKLLMVLMDNSTSARWALEIAIRERFDRDQDVLNLVHVQSCKEVISTSYMGVPIYSKGRPRVFAQTQMLLQHYGNSASELSASTRVILKCLISDLNPAEAFLHWIDSDEFKSELSALFEADPANRCEVIVGKAEYRWMDLLRALVNVSPPRPHIADTILQQCPFSCTVVQQESRSSELIQKAISFVESHPSSVL